jgi:hypothetical protein
LGAIGKGVNMVGLVEAFAVAPSSAIEESGNRHGIIRLAQIAEHRVRGLPLARRKCEIISALMKMG